MKRPNRRRGYTPLFSVDTPSGVGTRPFQASHANRCTVSLFCASCSYGRFQAPYPQHGISTYEYIVALREQEQQGGVGLQSPQMSSVSSLTGFSSASSFNALQRSSWCTPPRLFLEDQSDAIHQEINKESNPNGKKTTPDEAHNSSTGNIKISTWTLARLNADEVSKAAAQARKKSKILQPIVKQIPPVPNPDSRRRCSSREILLPTEFPIESSAKLSTGVSDINTDELASCLAPLQFEARRAFRSIGAVSSAVLTSSPDSSLDSPEPNPVRISSSGVDDSEGPISLPSASAGAEIHRSAEFSGSASDGYEASGGEDSDIVPSRIVHRSLDWSSVIFNSDRGERIASRRIG